jgi:serine/threonine-protein kinase
MNEADRARAADDTEFRPGTVIAGKYVVERVLGEGGLAVVVRAKHIQLDAPVAIKHVRPSDVSRPGIVERFLREARLAAKIKSEHAVKVQDVDTLESGVPYMVMECLEGQDLAQVVLASPVPIDRAIDYVLQACEALAEAHAAGIVHRDLKPANLFLAERPGGTPIVKVLDFGISRRATERSRVTGTNEPIGTPDFMSPEQLQAARDIDARADIWALGVVLYELVTGKLPFEGDSMPQLCASILTKPHVPMSAVHPDTTPELEAVVARCLEKDRAKRYQNVAELAHDLAALWEGESPSRVQQIARVVSEALASPPQPSEPPAPPISASAPTALALSEPRAVTIDAGDADVFQVIASEVVDQVAAVFSDAEGAKVDEMAFVSIDEAYEFASTQPESVVRCDLYDELDGVRGRLRVTYVRNAETGHWVPVLT